MPSRSDTQVSIVDRPEQMAASIEARRLIARRHYRAALWVLMGGIVREMLSGILPARRQLHFDRSWEVRSVMRFAQGETARLSYEVVGPVGAPPVVCLHATLGDHRVFGDLAAALVAAGAGDYRLVLPDARGHGASAALTDRSFTVTDMATDLWAVLEAEGLAGADAHPLVLIGHGQGAVTALEVARVRPDRIAGLLLIEPDAPSLLDGETDPEVATLREGARERYREVADLAYKGQVQPAVDRYMAFRWGAWQEELARPQIAAVRRHASALTASLDALGRFPILPEELRALTVPVHVLTATSSPEVIDAIGRRVAAVVPGARYRKIGKITLGTPVGSELMLEVLRPQIAALAKGGRGIG